MLNVKVATDKEGGRIWDLQGAVPFGREMQNANCPIWSAKADEHSQHRLKDHLMIKRTEFENFNLDIAGVNTKCLEWMRVSKLKYEWKSSKFSSTHRRFTG